MRSFHDLTTAEAHALATALGDSLPPLEAVENEDWGRDYVLQKLLAHTAAELASVGLVSPLASETEEG